MSDLHRVVVVEDSPTTQLFLQQILTESGFLVTGVASTVRQAEKLVAQTHPHLLLCDIRLPDGNGIELTRRIMSTNPLPIVLLTAYNPTDRDLVFQAMDAGALDVMPKPPARNHPEFKNYVDQLTRTLRNLVGIPLIRRSPLIRDSKAGHSMPLRRSRAAAPSYDTQAPILAIGASTGGPTIVANLLEALSAPDFQFVIVAQHMVPDFLGSFQNWLESRMGTKVQMATHSEYPSPHGVYLVPPNFHLRISPDRSFQLLSPVEVQSAHVPSITTLFESLAFCTPQQVIAILLTGMGKDGSRGLKALKDAGAYTIVQDPKTALISSMPEVAIQADAASVVMSPEEIASWLHDSGWRNLT